MCDGTNEALGTSFSVQLLLLLLATSSPVVQVTDLRTPFGFPLSTLAFVSTNGCLVVRSCLVFNPAMTVPPPPALSSFFLFCDVLNRFQLSALIRAECFFRLFSSVPF